MNKEEAWKSLEKQILKDKPIAFVDPTNKNQLRLMKNLNNPILKTEYHSDLYRESYPDFMQWLAKNGVKTK